MYYNNKKYYSYNNENYNNSNYKCNNKYCSCLNCNYNKCKEQSDNNQCKYHNNKKDFNFYKKNLITSLEEVECFLDNAVTASWYIKLIKLFKLHK